MSSMLELPPVTEVLPPALPEGDRPHLRVVPDQPEVPLDFDEAVRRITPRLQRYAKRRLGDAHEAEELVQEALLRAYKHGDALRTEDDLIAWCTVVTGRLVIDRLRVRGRSTCVAEMPEGTRVARDTADVVVARDEARLALDALDAMPARQAAVLWAREVEGQGYDEIGERFGMSEPAVRSILTRARKALRKEYALRGGTLPVGGLAVLAPWVRGLRWADRVRSAATKLAAPAAIGAMALGLVGGALHTPAVGRDGAAPVIAQAVVHSAADAEVGRDRPAPALLRHPARPGVAHGATGTAAAHARVATWSEAGPLKTGCISARGAGAGGAGCAPGTDPGTRIYLTQRLPENPTHIRDVGVETDKVDCSQVPTTPLTTCTTEPTSGGTR